ncbi:hypothetical protein P3499_24375, partial [Vibrio parahaemolyticus]|nr:hypothetical protein [Vibrio parahaemolyticus]
LYRSKKKPVNLMMGFFIEQTRKRATGIKSGPSFFKMLLVTSLCMNFIDENLLTFFWKAIYFPD